jgi:integrase/recombinase XerD
MSKRKAPKGCFWRGQVLWGRIQAGGRDIKWSLRTNDPTTAKRRVESERARAVAAIHYGDHRRTFQEVLEAWSKSIISQVGQRTVARYAGSLGILQPWLDGLYLDEIDKKFVGEIVEARQKAGVTNATIKRDLTALSSVLSFAEDQEWRDDNPVLSWLRPKARRKSRIRERRDPIVLPDPAHVRMMIDQAPGLFAALIRAAWVTGARQEELTKAKRTQVDHASKQLTVIGKGNKVRVIDLSDGYEEVFKPIPSTLASPWLFWHSTGEPFSSPASNFRRVMAIVVKKAQKQEQEFRRFRFHDLRHLHAVQYLKDGHSIYDLQHRLGHTSIKTTEMYLVYLTPEEKRTAMLGSAGAGTKSGTQAAVSDLTTMKKSLRHSDKVK